MFIVDDYQIEFWKSHSLIISKNKGRFDTVCQISDKYSGNLFKGVAYLHPKDSYDKVIGKKIALTRALADMRVNRGFRTMIWRAFWEWVESWKQNYKTKKIRKYAIAEIVCGHTIKLVHESLAFCTTCKAGEGELTTECCGRKMTEEERNRVYKIGDLDFINGKWTEKKIGKRR